MIEKRIIPLLDQLPPRGVKYHEYEILKQGLLLMGDESISKTEKQIKMRELKEKSHKVIQVSPVVSSSTEDQSKEAIEVIENISVEHLRAIYTPSWIAGFVEGDGSFQINDRLQTVFEVAQMNDKMAIYALHKI